MIPLQKLKILEPPIELRPVPYNLDDMFRVIDHIGGILVSRGKTLAGGQRQFILSATLKNFYTQLIYYFFNDSRFCGDIYKGLFISGNYGTGKTLSMRIFRQISYSRLLENTRKGFNYAPCEKIASDYELGGIEAIDKYCSNNWCYDDLGNENKDKNGIPYAMHYGTPRNVMQDILTRQYRHFVEHGTIVIVTSNFNLEGIKFLYGERVADRFYEMFNEINLTGDSFRTK